MINIETFTVFISSERAAGFASLYILMRTYYALQCRPLLIGYNCGTTLRYGAGSFYYYFRNTPSFFHYLDFPFYVAICYCNNCGAGGASIKEHFHRSPGTRRVLRFEKMQRTHFRVCMPCFWPVLFLQQFIPPHSTTNCLDVCLWCTDYESRIMGLGGMGIWIKLIILLLFLFLCSSVRLQTRYLQHFFRCLIYIYLTSQLRCYHNSVVLKNLTYLSSNYIMVSNRTCLPVSIDCIINCLAASVSLEFRF